jgi:GNAT superfamily N-acetyltransferase
MVIGITTTSARPDLVPLVARWLHDAFSYPGSRSVEEIIASFNAPLNGPEETFVLFEDDTPVGKASLTHDDLTVRPDLTPWMAGVVVLEPYRSRGYATALVRCVEGFARGKSVSTLWLYTWTAEALYSHLGWERVETELNRGEELVTLMRRSLVF